MHKTDTYLNGLSLREQNDNDPSVMEVLISPGKKSGLGSLRLTNTGFSLKLDDLGQGI